jgi:hypothetical protein
LIGTLHVKLNESSRQLLFFPRCRRFAGAQADDHVFPPRRLSRAQSDILYDAVALVEDAQHRNALRHRRDAGLIGTCLRLPDGWCLALLSLPRLLLGRAVARGHGQNGQQRSAKPHHRYSGIQGS